MKQFIFLLLTAFILTDLPAQTLDEYLDKYELKTKTTPEGIHYSFDKKGKGTTPKTGDFVKINYRALLLNGQEVDRSHATDGYVFEVGYRQMVRGVDRGIQLFPVGSKGMLYFPAGLGYGDQGDGHLIPPDADLMYEIEVLEIMDYAAYDVYMRRTEEREKEEFLRREHAQLVQDRQIIREYAKSHNLKIKELPSGVAYVITKKGKGAPAGNSGLVEMSYEGYLPNDDYFDGEGRRSFRFWPGRGMVIDGLEEAITYFNEGAEGYILIPSKFAYGQRAIQEADTNVPANSVLIFEVKLDRVKGK